MAGPVPRQLHAGSGQQPDVTTCSVAAAVVGLLLTELDLLFADGLGHLLATT